MNRSDLSIEQEYALQLFEEGYNIFITGPAGTGKTCLIKQIIQNANIRKKKIQVCAMTGCAALLLDCNASTLHSWSGIGLGKNEPDDIFESIKNNKKKMSRWVGTQILVLDEVSMMSKRLFDLINFLGRKIRNNTKLFGGIQLVFTGDFYQLPPVSSKEEDGSGLFCFESNYWFDTFLPENHIVLSTIFRQEDSKYKEILNKIRKGNITNNDIKVLNEYVGRPFNSNNHNGCVPTKIFPTRRRVDEINTQMFNSIKEKSYEFQTKIKYDCTVIIDSGKPLSSKIIENNKNTRKEQKEYEIKFLIENCPCEQILKLKKGCNVMCTINLDIDSGICNGSIGVVIDFTITGMPVVSFYNGVVRPIETKYWQSDQYPCCAIGQIPLRLAWAMTIHKIQGATLSMAEIDVGQNTFEYGQSYVALSRIKSLDGLYLSNFSPEKIKAHPKVIKFYNSIPIIDYEEQEQEPEVNNPNIKTITLH